MDQLAIYSIHHRSGQSLELATRPRTFHTRGIPIIITLILIISSSNFHRHLSLCAMHPREILLINVGHTIGGHVVYSLS